MHFYVPAENSFEYFGVGLHDRHGIEYHELRFARSPDCLQLRRQHRSARRRRLDLPHHLHGAFVVVQVVREDFRVTRNQREEVVEVVRDSTRDLTSDLHRVRVTQFGLELAVIRHVIYQRQYPGCLSPRGWQECRRRAQDT